MRFIDRTGTDELPESVLALKDRVRGLLGAKASSGVDVVTLGAERDSLTESLTAKDADRQDSG